MSLHNDFLHFVPFFLHVRDQPELRAGTVEVLAVAVDSKIVVAVEIVRQETDTAFHRHGLRAKRKQLKLLLRQAGAGADIC